MRPSAKAAAAVPARLVSLLPPAARLRPLPRDSEPLADFALPEGSVALASFAAADSVVPASSAVANSAVTGEPGSTDAAARCFAALCSAAL